VIPEPRPSILPSSTCRGCGDPLPEVGYGRPRVFCIGCREKGVRGPRDETVGGDAARLSRELHAGMHEHGFGLRSLAREARRLGAPISVSALSDWVRGTSVPADPLDSPPLRALELALEKQTGDLSLVFTPPEPPPESPSKRAARPLTDYVCPSAEPESLSAASEQLQDLIKKFTGSQRVLVVEITTECRIDADHRFTSATHTLEVRAMNEDADNYWHRHAFTAAGKPTITANDGCSVARQRSNNDGIEAIELVFPAPLKRGDRHRFSFTVDYPNERNEATFYARAFHSPLAGATLKISFEAPPRELFECRWSLETIQPGDEVESTELDASWGRAVLSLRPPLVGARGWRWSW
jgi:hypothetical protein